MQHWKPASLLERGKRIVIAYRVETLVFAFFLAVALSRNSPYWQYGIDIPWYAGLALALLPVLPGLLLRRDDMLAKGYIVALFLPYQSAASLLSCLLIAVLLLRHGVQWFRDGAWSPGLRKPLFWCAVLAGYACFQWMTGITASHSASSSALAFLTIIATPLALLFLAKAVGELGATDRILRFLPAVIVAEALVIVLYPLIIGEPRLLAAVVNGFLKPLYTVLGRAWDYPWYDPDWNPGSLPIVNYSAVVMMVGAVHFFFRFIRERKLPLLLAFLLLAFTSILAENAVATGAAAAAFALLVVLSLLGRFPLRRAGRRVSVPLAALLTVGALAAFLSATYIGPGRFAGTQKGLFYRHALSTVPCRALPAVLGYGPGAYGSRVAQLRLTDDLYGQRAQLSRYPLFRDDFTALGGDYTGDVIIVLHRKAEWVGASQGTLFSGLIPLLFENGLLGLLPIIALCFLLLRVSLPPLPGTLHPPHGTESALFGMLFLLFLSVFYNYTEIPTIVVVCSLGGTLLLFRPPH